MGEPHDIPIRCRFWWHRWGLWKDCTFQMNNRENPEQHYQRMGQVRYCQDCHRQQQWTTG